MITPLAFADSLRIGSVDSVSPDEIKVLLDIGAGRCCFEHGYSSTISAYKQLRSIAK